MKNGYEVGTYLGRNKIKLIFLVRIKMYVYFKVNIP